MWAGRLVRDGIDNGAGHIGRLFRQLVKVFYHHKLVAPHLVHQLAQ